MRILFIIPVIEYLSLIFFNFINFDFAYVIILDPLVVEALKPWRKEINLIGNRVIGRSAVYLQQKECSTGECNLGNFVTDAMLYAVNLYINNFCFVFK